MDFLKFFFKDIGNKMFCYFVLIFILVFHVIGSQIANVTWRDIFPMYIIIGAALLTILIYTISKYRAQKKESSDQNDDYLVIRGNDKKSD